MLTNHTSEAVTKAKDTFKRYYGDNLPKEGEYVPYTDPFSVLHWLGVSLVVMKDPSFGIVATVSRNDLLGVVIQYNGNAKSVDQALSLIIGHLQLGHIQWGEGKISYYDWGSCDVDPLYVEMSSVFVRELFKHNIVEVR